MEELSAQTQNTVSLLQELYENYRKLTNDAYILSPGEKRKRYWGDVAVYLNSLGVIPERYVALLFRLYPDPAYPPFPSILNGTKLKEAARHLNAYEEEKAASFWQMMHSLFNSHVKSAGRAPAAVLNDDTLYFNPPFRYAIAKFLDLPSTAEMWHQEAINFCKNNPAFIKEMQRIGVNL